MRGGELLFTHGSSVQGLVWEEVLPLHRHDLQLVWHARVTGHRYGRGLGIPPFPPPSPTCSSLCLMPPSLAFFCSPGH